MTELQKEAETAVRKHGGIRQAASAMGIAPSTLQGRLARRRAVTGEVSAPPIPEIAKPPHGFAVFRNSGAYDSDGKLLKQWVGTKPDSGEEYAVPAGHVVKGESALLDPDGRVMAKWVKTREGAGDGLVEGLRAAFAEYDGRAPQIASPEVADDDLLTIYPLPDLHLGMYAWGRETGEKYDVPIAVQMATRSVERLVTQSRPSRRAVILGLGDYFHANDAKAVTPHSGNRLDVDGRWPKVFAAGAKLATAIVDIVARKHAELEIVFLPGNHDPDAAMSLTVALALFYSQTPHIEVHQEPGIAWYHRFGKVLLGATHGHTMKPDRMAMMLASDRAEDWGQTTHRHFFFGHIHHKTAEEIGPVTVESFQSPAAKDAFASSGGYRATRALHAITYHREDGEIGRHRVNITGNG